LGGENPHEIVEYVWDSPKLNAFCVISSVKVYGPFFFAEPTVTGISYLYMLENYLMPKLQQDMERYFIFQQDMAPPHFHDEVTSYLNRTVVAWIGRGGTIAWPSRSPDLTSLGFSVWGYVKDKVFVPPPPASLEKLWARITAAVATIDVDTIHRIWDEIAYRWDICRMTREKHIQHL
jgi:hypothetical protein